MRVLLVDDDPALLEVLGAYLRGAGFEVLEARDWQKAQGLFPWPLCGTLWRGGAESYPFQAIPATWGPPG